MQAAAQDYVDSSISKTINLPRDISFEDFKGVYEEAYAQGCKGCTTYRPNDVTGAVLEVKPAAEVARLVPSAMEPTDRVVYIAQPLDRPEDLPGKTYKIKWPGSDHAIYITINDVMQDGRRRPFEIFINSKNMEHYAWTVALTRMISAVFRRGGDVSFVVEELKAVFDPRGGQWMEGRYDALAAGRDRWGDRASSDRHRLPGAGGCPALIDEAVRKRLQLACWFAPAERWASPSPAAATMPTKLRPVPQLRRRCTQPSGRLRHLPQLRLFTLRLIPSAVARAGDVMGRRIIFSAMLALATIAGMIAGAADAQPLPSSRDSLQFSYAPLVKRVSPAVVNIYTATTQRVQRRLPFPFPGMPQDGGSRVQNALGSGVLVKADGLIVTNSHVVRGADEIRVVLADRREFDAKVLAQDERYDLALLRIDGAGEKFPFLELRDSDSIEVGDVVLAIGNPFGLNQTVTSGIISAVARSAGGVNDSSFFLQTDAAINPGNSGGALVSLDGRLIGINTAIFSQTGGSVGIGFATPSNIVARMIETGAAGGRIVRPWLGISMQPVTADLATGLNLPRPAGLVVKDVFAGGPGERAGIKRNDVIVALRDQPIDDEAGLRFRLATLSVGETVPIKVVRGGKEVTLQLPLSAPPEDPPRDRSVLEGRNPLNGATVVNLSPAVAEEMGLIEWKPGVGVVEIKPGSYSARFLKTGDMVIAINGQEVKSVADLKKRIAAGAPRSLSVGREGLVSTIQFQAKAADPP